LAVAVCCIARGQRPPTEASFPSLDPLAYGLVSVSYHWNNFLWPLIATSSVESRPLTVGLQVFSSSDQGIDWSVICAATLMTSAPLLIAFVLFQRQFVQSFMRAGIR
jgi:sn-glycerol 3-phosphate transport system permease protein